MKSLPPDKEGFLKTLAERIVPESAALDRKGWERFTAIVDGALLDRPEAVGKQFQSFLGLLRVSPVLRYGRPFDALDGTRQDAVLRWFEDCPVGLLRKGTWGLKAMVFMGYYGQPELHEQLGYAPDRNGGRALHA